jgi:hypothetical protein
MDTEWKGRHEHEALELFVLIASEVRRLESFEADLPVELSRLRASIEALSATPPRLLLGAPLDRAVVPARRLAVALGGWVGGLNRPARTVAMAQVASATRDLADVVAVMRSRVPEAAASAVALRATADILPFRELAEDYVKDAHKQSNAMTLLYMVSLAVLMLAAAAAIWAAGGPALGAPFAVDQFLARGSVVLVLLLGALATVWQADRHRRGAAEQLRIARQLRTLPAFIDSIDSKPMKDLMRGTVAARFFPRALDDDDVLREPQWPDPSQLLEALEGEEEAGGEEPPVADADRTRNRSSTAQGSSESPL